MTYSQVRDFLSSGRFEVKGHTLTLEDVFISYRFDDTKLDKERFEAHGSQEVREQTEYRPVIKIGPKGALGRHEIRPIHSTPSLGQGIAVE